MARASTVIALTVFALSLGRSLAATTKSPASNNASTSTMAPASQDRSTDEMKTKEMAVPSDPETSKEMSSEEMEGPMVDVLAIMSDCNDTFRIEMGYMEALNESGSFPDETDRTPKCYVRCFLEKTGVASQDGVFDPALAATIFFGERNGKAMDDLQDMATACAANRKESCKCERSYKFLKCLMEAEIKKYEAN